MVPALLMYLVLCPFFRFFCVIVSYHHQGLRTDVAVATEGHWMHKIFKGFVLPKEVIGALSRHLVQTYIVYTLVCINIHSHTQHTYAQACPCVHFLRVS